MDVLDRIVGHDAWTTRQIALRCLELSDEELDRTFDIDHGSVRGVLRHMVHNMEVWTDLILERPVQSHDHSARPTIAELLGRHDRASSEFAAVARQITDEARLDELWLDRLDDPPTQKTYGGAIYHVVSHNMHHRAHLLLLLGWLGVRELPEGDVLSWEGQP